MTCCWHNWIHTGEIYKCSICGKISRKDPRGKIQPTKPRRRSEKPLHSSRKKKSSFGTGEDIQGSLNRIEESW